MNTEEPENTWTNDVPVRVGILSPTDDERDVYMTEVDDAYAMSPDEFVKKPARERERIMFILQREQAGQVRLLLFKVEEWEAKLNATLTPEGMEQIKDKFLESFGGGMLKGLF